MCVVDSAG